MNISSIQNVIWVGSLACASYLGFFLYEFKQPESQARLQRLNNDFIKGALEDVKFPEPEVYMEFDFPVVKRLFHDMNWSGKEPEVIVVKEPDKTPTTTAKAKPMGDLVEVLWVRAASFDPSASQALVSYKDSQMSRSKSVKDGAAELYVGDYLPSPHAYCFVKDIVEAGVVFGFDDEGREPELVEPPVFMDGIHIVEAGPDGALMPAATASIGSLPDAPVYNPDRTMLIDRNHYKVGTDDAERFATDYAAIIAQIDHRRHRNPSTGQYDGIEIQDVPAGSIAAQHGVKSGDIIKSINGHPVSSVQEAIQFGKNNSEKYSTWEIVIENKGVERTVTYDSPSD
ncbi:MAG: PDZ domain-containing protein [Planctomycetota bacterium]|nr:PDZ domain-containing protein [Planctomycetota bacterium]